MAAVRNRRVGRVLFLGLLLSGCVRYQPSPLNPPRLESDFRSRSLSDAGLRAFVAANAPSQTSAWPPASWNADSLTLVAFYYSPELDVARARVATAEAGVITAGGRANPSVGGAAGGTNSPESPYVFRFGLDFTIETAGKRGYRILEAQKLAEAARLALGEAAWQVRSRVRSALAEHLLALQEAEILVREENIRREAASIYERRLAAGDISRPILDTARTELLNTQLVIQHNQGQVAESLAGLASALGLPVAALAGEKWDWPTLERPPSGESLSPAKVQRAGLLHRADVRRSLCEYAAAEARLQLEVARQYPDFQLAPDYEFGEGHNSYVLGTGLLVPLFNRHKGPIAEATARRKEAATRFLALQASVIDELERAGIRYRAALQEFTVADTTLKQLQHRREELTRRMVEAGESDRLDYVGLQLQSVALAKLRQDALRRLQSALGALEDAVQQPLDGAGPLPPMSKGGSVSEVPR